MEVESLRCLRRELAPPRIRPDPFPALGIWKRSRRTSLQCRAVRASVGNRGPVFGSSRCHGGRGLCADQRYSGKSKWPRTPVLPSSAATRPTSSACSTCSSTIPNCAVSPQPANASASRASISGQKSPAPSKRPTTTCWAGARASTCRVRRDRCALLPFRSRRWNLIIVMELSFKNSFTVVGGGRPALTAASIVAAIRLISLSFAMIPSGILLMFLLISGHCLPPKLPARYHQSPKGACLRLPPSLASSAASYDSVLAGCDRHALSYTVNL